MEELRSRAVYGVIMMELGYLFIMKLFVDYQYLGWPEVKYAVTIALIIGVCMYFLAMALVFLPFKEKMPQPYALTRVLSRNAHPT